MKLLKGPLLALGFFLAGAAAWSLSSPESPLGTWLRGALLIERVSAARPDVQVLYQFVDEGGTVHMVASLEEVPPDRRDGVGRIEVPVAPAVGARAAGAPEIVIYTTAWCGFCSKMLQELERQGLAYTNRDIERDAAARDELLRLVGSTGVPVTVVDGEVIRGYDPERLRRLAARAR